MNRTAVVRESFAACRKTRYSGRSTSGEGLFTLIIGTVYASYDRGPREFRCMPQNTLQWSLYIR